ncbi:MAG TPA: sugar ABC transporter ATP-binding protein [Vicinamibacterales bacterium]|nr:sugar ABC transporter ATP-binding protein [Vicinamibacterales bacterium]
MEAVAFEHIDKSFGAVAALRDVTFAVAAGESHAIVGENGAGKSTLLNILAGSLRPDRGQVTLGGTPVTLASPRDALARGIGLVHQEMLAFPNLSATANIFAGREITGRFGWLRESEMRARASDLLARLQLPISPDASVESLPVAHRQLLQVARALAFDCRLLALDEPTTSLTAAETDHLFRVLGDLMRAGVTIVYVSHRLPDVFRLCDRITVLRDGRLVETFARDAVSHDEIVRAMVGRSIPQRAPAPPPGAAGEPRLRVSGLTRRPCFEDVSLAIAPGEIVGLFGLVGSGRSELLETLVGVQSADRGSIAIDGRPVPATSPRAAARAGVVLVPEDRQRQGLCFNLSLRHNLALPAAATRGTLLVRDAEIDDSEALVRDWRIAAPSTAITPDSLSGGNQQKIVLAKWLALGPRVLLLDEPTKGVDVAAKYDIHGIVLELAARGTAVLLVSSDLPEVLALADRVLVMREGRLQGELTAGADEESVMRLATAPLSIGGVRLPFDGAQGRPFGRAQGGQGDGGTTS